jgi:hypothetical protein
MPVQFCHPRIFRIYVHTSYRNPGADQAGVIIGIDGEYIERGDMLGYSLAVADANGDGREDLF